jgi:hypothetical protein
MEATFRLCVASRSRLGADTRGRIVGVVGLVVDAP